MPDGREQCDETAIPIAQQNRALLHAKRRDARCDVIRDKLEFAANKVRVTKTGQPQHNHLMTLGQSLVNEVKTAFV